MILKKLCLLGEASVGKTSLVRRYVDRQFSDSYLSTVGVKISRKVLTIPGTSAGTPAEMQLILWDIEGLTNPRVASPSYLTGAHGAVVVGDVSRPLTIEAIGKHIDLFREINPQGVVIIALNKSDLAPDPSSYLGRWAQRQEAPVTLLTSAKNGSGVDRLFETIGAQLAEGAIHGSDH